MNVDARSFPAKLGDAESLKPGDRVLYTGRAYPELEHGEIYEVEFTNPKHPGVITLRGSFGVYHGINFADIKKFKLKDHME